MFSNTLQGPYLIAGCTSTFSHLVVVGERIERGLKMGNIQDVAIASEFLEQIDEDASTIFEDEEEAPAYPPFQIPNQVTKATSNRVFHKSVVQLSVKHQVSMLPNIRTLDNKLIDKIVNGEAG